MSRPEMIAKLRRTGAVVCPRCVVADSVHSRLVGLLGHDKLAADEGLLLDPCNQVHSLFMRCAIDVVFLDRANRVVKTRALPPWRMTSIIWKSRKVLELPFGAIERSGLQVGDELEFEHA